MCSLRCGVQRFMWIHPSALCIGLEFYPHKLLSQQVMYLLYIHLLTMVYMLCYTLVIIAISDKKKHMKLIVKV